MRVRKSRAPVAKLTIIGIDQRGTVEAQYNPKEIGVDKSVPWQKSPTSTSDQPALTFTSADGRTVSFELLFDTAKQGTNVHETHVAGLLAFTMVMDPNGPEDKRRPPRVKVVWRSALPAFEGVIESVNTKYTMFLPNGTPVRATCAVKIREASRVSFKKVGG
jgi:Contractile injection system tube protein